MISGVILQKSILPPVLFTSYAGFSCTEKLPSRFTLLLISGETAPTDKSYSSDIGLNVALPGLVAVIIVTPTFNGVILPSVETVATAISLLSYVIFLSVTLPPVASNL